jgi:hypothetical protein
MSHNCGDCACLPWMVVCNHVSCTGAGARTRSQRGQAAQSRRARCRAAPARRRHVRAAGGLAGRAAGHFSGHAGQGGAARWPRQPVLWRRAAGAGARAGARAPRPGRGRGLGDPVHIWQQRAGQANVVASFMRGCSSVKLCSEKSERGAVQPCAGERSLVAWRQGVAAQLGLARAAAPHGSRCLTLAVPAPGPERAAPLRLPCERRWRP